MYVLENSSTPLVLVYTMTPAGGPPILNWSLAVSSWYLLILSGLEWYSTPHLDSRPSTLLRT